MSRGGLLVIQQPPFMTFPYSRLNRAFRGHAVFPAHGPDRAVVISASRDSDFLPLLAPLLPERAPPALGPSFVDTRISNCAIEESPPTT